MATLKNLTPGQTLYAVTRETMGNTTTTIGRLHSIIVESVDAEAGTVTASWDSRPARTYRENVVKRWRVKRPEPKGTRFGQTSY